MAIEYQAIARYINDADLLICFSCKWDTMDVRDLLLAFKVQMEAQMKAVFPLVVNLRQRNLIYQYFMTILVLVACSYLAI